MKIQEVNFLDTFSGFLDAPMLGNMLTGKGVKRAGKKVFVRTGRGYNNIDQMDKHFQFHSIFKQYRGY